MILFHLNNFHFLRPFWLLAIIPMLLTVWVFWRLQKFTSTWDKVCEPHLLALLREKKDKNYQRWPIILLLLAWSLVIFILSGPTWSRLPIPVYFSKAARIIALDLSPSMLATDIKPDRITRARFKIIDILNRLPTGQTGLLVFADEAYDVAPLTFDRKSLQALVLQLTPGIMPVAGSNIAAALIKAKQMMQQSGSKTGNIILITDNKPNAYDFNVVKDLVQEGFRLSVLGMGSPNKVISASSNSSDENDSTIQPLDSASLQKLAKSGGGNYAMFTSDNQDVDKLIQPLLLNEKNFEINIQKASANRWYDEGRWFLLGILPLVLILFRRGWLELLW